MNNKQLTNLDTDQIVKRKYDANYDAERVFLVGGENLNFSIDSDKIANAVKEGLKDIKIEIKQPEIVPLLTEKEIEKISLSKRDADLFFSALTTLDESNSALKSAFKDYEKQVFIPQIEYRTIEIEKPIYIEKVVTVEKPIVIKEIEFKEIIKEKEVPKWQKVCILLQTIALFGIILMHFIK